MLLVLYGVLSREIAEVIEVFATQAQADLVVATWDADEPEQAGALEVLRLEFVLSEN